jgi:hypothetical protein
VERNSETSKEKILKNIRKGMIEDRLTQKDGMKGNRNEERKDRR